MRTAVSHREAVSTRLTKPANDLGGKAERAQAVTPDAQIRTTISHESGVKVEEVGAALRTHNMANVTNVVAVA